MTAKEKALELVSKMCLLDYRDENIIIAKQCALICVDEILDLQLELAHDDNVVNIEEFYIEVKQEIIKI